MISDQEYFITSLKRSFLKQSSLFTKANPNESFTSSRKMSIVTNQDEMFSQSNIKESIVSDESEIKTYNNADSKFDSGIPFDVSGTLICNNTIEILKPLGQGGQASVYLGKINELDKYVAVKHYQKDISQKEEIERIKNEIMRLKKLNHRNIVYYYDLDIETVGNICNIYIIMEYLETNLEDFLDWYRMENTIKYLPLDLVSYITRNILQGLVYLHQNKIINRDLKPANILLNRDLSEVKITDFGISTNVKQSKTLIQRTSGVGTYIYRSPEFAFGKPYGYDCDIWSLGCIVFELVGGMRPHELVEDGPYGFGIAQFSSPLETADDDVLDIIYDRKNRVLLDFLQKCWRGNNKYRPDAKELLNHKFVEIPSNNNK